MTTEAESARHGWTAGHLKLLDEDDPRYWSTAEAARLLGPPQLTEAQVRVLVNILRLEPKGKKPAGSGRRHVRAYDAVKLIGIYERLLEVTEE